MSDPDLNELKRRLRAEGFEIYRTREDHVSLAERVRDNLILDSGIAIGLSVGEATLPIDDAERPFSVRVTVRAQASHFPGASSEAVASRADVLAEGLEGLGYERETSRSSGLPDPGDPRRSLDTSYEVVLRRSVLGLPSLFGELRAAFAACRASSDD
jgi:hypothetical protein